MLRENARRPDQEPEGFLHLTKAEAEHAQENSNQVRAYKTVAVQKNGTTFFHRILSRENLPGSNSSSPDHTTVEELKSPSFKVSFENVCDVQLVFIPSRWLFKMFS